MVILTKIFNNRKNAVLTVVVNRFVDKQIMPMLVSARQEVRKFVS